ncbi:TIGR03621 family F420-dependent LLM class oxidoreductase [Amycolatopsis ultiminotia]|uniref:TIGR03621 family F420-dependent LLM class oxidoreductase n=1 Tax=Amycolatopsis ultiminotia TaxID=543629 RepID=A0ABP6Y283_9PSEU
MSEKPFRFGVTMFVPSSRAEWMAKCRRAEKLGYDVIGVADHLGLAPPFPAMVLAAEATERVRLTTFVLNAAFYHPTLLAREVAGTDRFTDGRIEIGLGGGYLKAEFEAAGIPWETAGRRVDQLERTVAELERCYADPGQEPRPAQRSGPPLLIAGRGDRVLTLAAGHADIVGFSGTVHGNTGCRPGLADAGAIAERVEFVRGKLGNRADDVEFNISVYHLVITDDRETALVKAQEELPDLTVAQIAELPTAYFGTAAEIADRLRENRRRFGFGYVTVNELELEAFAPVIALLR